ncbi:hypothetical protein I302_106865 [Kwoniella bestiolae CBS 10118]|uniref:Inositol-pentakisphosphate 2-kinase n=1 Tax=Kwoniella bestiolae CBS 10118 TaxID=1296100 RepID=A0AAJ8KC44_9TREE
MVSILSFFQTKKKGKRTRSRSPSPTLPSSPIPGPSTQATSANTSRPTRFLSLRHKSGSSSSTKPYDLTGRRGSNNELTRKRSKGKSPESSKPDLISAFVPKLDLGFDVPKTEDAVQKDSLDIHGVGEIVALRQQEKEVIGNLKLSVDDVRIAWEVIGKALRESNLNIHSLMLPLRPNADSTTQMYLLALYSLVIKPDLLSKFPTIAAQFAQPTTNPAEIWRERLISILRDVNSTSNLSEVLKYTLHRLHPIPPEPLIDIGLYTRFVQAERSSSYPLNAFDTLLSPRLKAGVANYFNEVLEVWSAVITHAEQNGMTPGRLAYLLGWWTLGSSVEKLGSWEDLYTDWKSAGWRMEHLLYVWIRYQSTKMQLPTRLLEVVERYPFAATSTDPDYIPSPPPSSFPRPTLRIILTSSSPVHGLFDNAHEILSAALSAKVDETALTPIWSSLVKGEGRKLDDLLVEDSIIFLRKVSSTADSIPSTPNLTAAGSQSPNQAATTPSYQPLSGGTLRGRYHSHSGDLSSPTTNLSSSTTSPNLSTLLTVKKEDDSPKSLKKQASLGVLPKNGDSAWDDFQKSGFGDSPKTVGNLGLAFSPKSSSTPISPTASATKLRLGTDMSDRPTPQKRTTFRESKNPTTVYSIEKEEIIELDDMFIAFVEDAQLDPPSITSWPPFSLVRLNPSVSSSLPEKLIDLLLITVVHRAPAAPEPRSEPTPEHELNRSTSPSSSKAGTPRGFKGITESFKRSSSFQSGMNLRRSFFGTSGFSLSRHASDELGTLPESESSESRQLRAPLSASSLTPTEYTITEMGEMIKIPSPNEKAELSAPGSTIADHVESSLGVKNEEDADVATIKGKSMITGLTSGPSVDSLASQWQYVGEGAEHIVFSHRGTMSEYNGMVLRLRKSQFLGNSPTDPEYRQTLNEWIFRLLPRLVPPELLIQTQEVNLSEGWVRDLFTQADPTRPEERKMSGDLKSLVVGEAKGVIMEDTTTNEKKDGIVNLAFEIKPKWGFLPDASTIIPPEAAEIKSKYCRFCMHRHLKGHDSSAEGKFCPLDLYSGDESRMRKAINGLWGIWQESGGKENNWRVFVNGERVIPDRVDEVAKYFEGKEALADQIATLIIPILQKSLVFQTLKNLQATLDPTDISDLSSRFSSAHPDTEPFDPALIPSPPASELREFIELYLSSPTSGKNQETWTLRQRMIAFALSAIFKDCSVFVKLTLSSSSSSSTLVPPPAEEVKWDLVEGSGKVKLIDLDMKPIQNLGKWKETDNKIWKYWLETHPTGATTIDDGSPITVSEKARDADGALTEASEGVVEERAHLDIPLRDKAISGLTLGGISEVGPDGASTRAMFVPTPDRTRENTPLPDPAPVGGSMEDSLSLSAVEHREDDAAQGEPTVEEQNESIPSKQITEEDGEEPRRTKRSLAPSPSPPPLPPSDVVSPIEPEEEKMTAQDVQGVTSDPTSQDQDAREDMLANSSPSIVQVEEKQDEGGSIVGAGLAGIGTVVGLAAGAVTAIVHDLGGPAEAEQDTLAGDKDIVKDDLPVIEGEVVDQISQDDTTTTSVQPAVGADQPKEDIASQPEPHVVSGPTAEVPDVVENADGVTLSVGKDEKVKETTGDDSAVSKNPLPEEVSDLASPQADEAKEITSVDTPQAELDNFYTPAETPLIPQPNTFEQPVALPPLPDLQDSSDLSDIAELSDKYGIDDDAVQPTPESGQGEKKQAKTTSVETPKLTIIPIEDAAPERTYDADMTPLPRVEEVVKNALAPATAEHAREEFSVVEIPSNEIVAHEDEETTCPSAIQGKEEVIVPTGGDDGIPASLPEEERSGESRVVTPLDGPDSGAKQRVANSLDKETEIPADANDGPIIDSTPHSEGATETQHASTPGPATIPDSSVAESSNEDTPQPDLTGKASERNDARSSSSDVQGDPATTSKEEHSAALDDPVTLNSEEEPAAQTEAGITPEDHASSSQDAFQEESAAEPKRSSLPPALGQPIDIPSDSSPHNEEQSPSDNIPIKSEPSSETQDHLSPLVADHHQPTEPSHHELSTISEDGESYVPTSTDISRDRSLPTTEDGEEWVEDADDDADGKGEEETPRGAHEELSGEDGAIPVKFKGDDVVDRESDGLVDDVSPQKDIGEMPPADSDSEPVPLRAEEPSSSLTTARKEDSL